MDMHKLLGNDRIAIGCVLHGSKIRWILENVPGVRERRSGRIAFGTIDTWLIWKLTNGTLHAYGRHQRHPHHDVQPACCNGMKHCCNCSHTAIPAA